MPVKADTHILRQEVQRTAQPSGTSRLRDGPASARNDSLYARRVPVSNCTRVLPSLRFGTFSMLRVLHFSANLPPCSSAQSRLGIIVLHAAMEAGLAFMNHFPLFAVMLRLKDPARLPGGLNFDLVVPGSASPQKDCPVPSELASTPYLRMRVSARTECVKLRVRRLRLVCKKKIFSRITLSDWQVYSSSICNCPDAWHRITALSIFSDEC